MRSVATIGSFDGVHRGHRSLLAQVRSIADVRGMRAVAVTFAASPKRVLRCGEVPVLNTTEERTALLRQAGMDEVAVLDFTSQMAAMSARDFMQLVLSDELHVAVLVIGYDHRFGHGRAEGFDDYVRYGQEIGIEVVRGEACTDKGEPISSTRIRHLLTEGCIEETNHLLGYRYMLRGKVVDGYKEGRKMGFPTANIQPLDADKQIPADGVYAVYVNVNDDDNDDKNDNMNKVDGEDNSELRIQNSEFKLIGMLNIGYRPTLNNGQERSIEVHILDFEGSLYGKTITVEFHKFLRPEEKFPSLEILQQQIQTDAQQTKAYFQNP